MGLFLCQPQSQKIILSTIPSYTIVADSSEATGLKWATASSGGLTLIETLSMSGSSVTSSSISGSYKNLYIVGRAITNSISETAHLRFNSDTGSNYSYYGNDVNNGSASTYQGIATSIITLGEISSNTDYNKKLNFEIDIPRYSQTEVKSAQIFCVGYNSAYSYYAYGLRRGYWSNTNAITTITIGAGGGTFSAGSVYIYGVN